MFNILGVDTKEQADIFTSKASNVICIPNVYVKSILNPKRINIWYGPRFTAKSYTKAIELLYCAYHLPYFRCVFARNTAKATKSQQFRLFKDTLLRYPFLAKEFRINETEMIITCIRNGNYLQGGSFEKGQALLSLVPDPTRFWVDEPISWNGSIKYDIFLTLMGNLRGPNQEPVSFDFTFNPINKKNFIYRDFFDPQTIKYNDSEVSIMKVIVDDNCFCPQSSLDYLDMLKRTNPERYLVDGLGEFGEEQNDNPFFYHFEKIKFGDYYIIDGEYLDNSFDFNFNPTTLVIGQKVMGVGLFIYDCIQMNGGTENLCLNTKDIIDSHSGGIRVTGDFSGNQRSASGGMIAGQEVTDYLKIKQTWGISDRQLHNTRTVNPQLHRSRELCNSVFYHIPIFFADTEGCRDLYDEIQKAKATESLDGKIGLFKNRDLGYGMDGVDALRYLFNMWFPDDERDVQKFIRSLG